MNILLAVSGSISAYKTFDLCRLFLQQGHQVRVVLTAGGEKFVRPEVYKYLGAQAVYRCQDDFLLADSSEHLSALQEPGTGNSILHVQLAKWAHRLIICPCTANTLSRLAQGVADDLLCSLFLVMREKPIIIYPAMNTQMYLHPLTQENIKRLKSLPHIFVSPPASGELACGDVGEGKLPSVESIAENSPIIPLPWAIKEGKKILITTGATVAPLDPIRFLANPSSGLTGYFLAKKFIQEGYHVTLVAGAQSTPRLQFLVGLPQLQLEFATTTPQMDEIIFKHFSQCDLYISAAAIADFQFKTALQKIKKNDFNFSLPYEKGIDILEKVLKVRRPEQKIVGFAAETEISPEILAGKWRKKPVDLLVGNQVHSGLSDLTHKAQGFGQDRNHYFFVKEGKIVENKDLTKEELAQKIYTWTTQWFE